MELIGPGNLGARISLLQWDPWKSPSYWPERVMGRNTLASPFLLSFNPPLVFLIRIDEPSSEASFEGFQGCNSQDSTLYNTELSRGSMGNGSETKQIND